MYILKCILYIKKCISQIFFKHYKNKSYLSITYANMDENGTHSSNKVKRERKNDS